MDLDSARDDLVVAAVTAGSLVALGLANRFLLDSDPSIYVKISPLYVYLVYLATRDGKFHGSIDTPRNWALAAILVATITFVLVAI